MKNSKLCYYATGKRKTAVARVFLTPGVGRLTVNYKPLDQYFLKETARMMVKQPLVITAMLDNVDVKVTVNGGGSSGQAGAVRLGIARALVAYDERQTTVDDSSSAGEGQLSSVFAEALQDAYVAAADSEQHPGLSVRKLLRSAGLLTRDSRVVERKKVGRHKARRGTQYSKR